MLKSGNRLLRRERGRRRAFLARMLATFFQTPKQAIIFGMTAADQVSNTNAPGPAKSRANERRLLSIRRSKKKAPDCTQPMSEEEVRALPSFKSWGKERIALLLQTVQAFTEIVYHAWSRQEAKPFDSVKASPTITVSLPRTRSRKAA